MQVPRWVPFAFRQSMANMQTPLWLVFLDMQGRFRMFLPAVPGKTRILNDCGEKCVSNKFPVITKN
jgi:hypothetical protein